MKQYQHRIATVRTFLFQNDIELGFRRLLDCVLDTQNIAIYNDAIQLTQWKYSSAYNTDQFIEKAHELLDKLAHIEIFESERTSIIKAEKIIKNYKNRKFTLGPVSLELKKGEIHGLVGENGNGKTTLLRILANELTTSSGVIEYNFKEKEHFNYALRTKLVYIAQRTQKWYGSLQDNLSFVLANYGVPACEIQSRVLLMIARFGLWKYKDLKWDQLSSGYKMRFELARTMLRKPEVLLLDEPLANLDILAQQIVLEDLKGLANSINNPMAVILSSQQLYEVEKIADHVIFLKDGKQFTNNKEQVTSEKLIIELETSIDKVKLIEVFKLLKLNDLVFNGGVYFAYFDNQTTFNQVLQVIVSSNVPVIYIRDISKSTRRFFVD